MERTALKSFLTHLCADSPWKYAVFWKLKHMLVTWEDGFCDYTKQKKSFKGKPDLTCSSEYSKILSFGHQLAVSDGSSSDFSIGFAIGYMSCLQYATGKGVIGTAAVTGDDRWVFIENSDSGESCSPKPEFPEEWNLQVTAGIKTILLVPLLPHGVLQLGSFDKVDEDLSVISQIRDIFDSSLYKGSLLQYSVPDSVAWTMLPTEMQSEDSGAVSTDYNARISPSVVQNMPEVLEHSSESDQSNSSSDPQNLSDILGQFIFTDAQETMSDFLNFSYMDEVINYSLLYGENDDGFSTLHMHEDVREEPTMVSNDIHTIPTVTATFFGFPVDCELLSGFETCFPEENFNYGCVSNEDLISSNFDQPPWEYSGYFDEQNHEEPLPAVVPSIFEQSDNVNSCTIHSPEVASEKSVPPTHELMSFFIGVDDFHHSVTPTPSPSSKNEEKKRKHGPSKRGVQQAVVSKKARLSNGRKPRPKDRQLIQDRLKELRDLVPKSEKCSIDSLLDKAIKHMQFQANVTEQAEKLRFAVDKEILPGEKSTEANNNHKGSSSAIQDLKLFPVTVKDLSHPGSMLIEMICNEEEVFFEITKVLSRLGLTILKSIMDANSGNNNTSAKFFVEAPTGFSKMEIFFPLMQLLQRRRNTMTV